MEQGLGVEKDADRFVQISSANLATKDGFFMIG
jgi:hypothetical protein